MMLARHRLHARERLRVELRPTTGVELQQLQPIDARITAEERRERRADDARDAGLTALDHLHDARTALGRLFEQALLLPQLCGRHPIIQEPHRPRLPPRRSWSARARRS